MAKLTLLGATALRSAAFAGLTLLAVPAFAQDTATTTTEADPAAQTETLPGAQETPATDASAAEDTIVVTGSRIRNTEFTSDLPVTVIDTEVSAKEGKIDLAEVIQSSPIAAGSSQITAAISSNFVTNGGPGASTISLRGLGAERTLVLLNGRRAGPAGTRGATGPFDLNVLPTSIVSNVQILKDGASSVYGSDAVAGVVNVITKRDTNGFEFNGYVSPPFQGGGEQYRISGTWGKDWGNAHILVSGDYYRREELSRRQRKYLDCPEDYIFDNDGKRADLIDPRTGSPRCDDLPWGQVWLYDYTYYYSPNGSNLVAPNGNPMRWAQYTYGQNLAPYTMPFTPLDPGQFGTPPGWVAVGYDPASQSVYNSYHPFQRDSTVIPLTERYTLYADGAVNLTDNIEFYAEGLWNRRFTYQNGFRQFWQFGYTSDFGGLGFGDPISVGWTGAALISPTTVTDWSDSSQTVYYMRGVAGFRGDFEIGDKKLNWDVYGQFSRSVGRYMSQQIFQDAIDTQDFRTSSCVGTFTAIRHVPCIDINWTDPDFLAGNISQEQRDFLFGTEVGRTVYEQRYFEASLAGEVIDLPAGAVGVAIGADYRRDEINDHPGEITLAGNSWGNTASGITAGYSETKEIFGELRIPLIHNTPFIQSLNFSAAGRMTNVKSIREFDGASDEDNGNWTYRLNAKWQVNDWLGFRATYGTSFRAPALFEQFLADETSFLSQRNVDPCIRYGSNPGLPQRVKDNCAADGIPANYNGGSVTATIFTGGGIGVLDPETSTAKTASILLTPRFDFLPSTRLNVAVDYFDIEVKGEISQLGAFNVVYGCYNSDFFPTDPLCSLFTRGQTAAPLSVATVHDSFVNVNSQRNEGIDVTIRVDQDLGSWGKIVASGSMTWQFTDTYALFEGTEVSNNGEDGEPIWVGDFNLAWSKGPTSIYYGLEVVGGTSDVGDYLDANPTLCPTTTISSAIGYYCVDLRGEPRFYHSLSITQEVADGRFEITGGVSNLFDTKPPRVSILNAGEISTLGQSVFSSQYDFVGRRAFVQVKAKF